jgi:hypothetical protein
MPSASTIVVAGDRIPVEVPANMVAFVAAQRPDNGQQAGDRALSCSDGGAPRGIRTPNRQIRSLVLCVDLVGSRRIWPAHVGGLVDPDGSRRIPSDRLDDQPDDQATEAWSTPQHPKQSDRGRASTRYSVWGRATRATRTITNMSRQASDYGVGCRTSLRVATWKIADSRRRWNQRG